MRATPEAIRKMFKLRYGESAFEAVAQRYAEVAGDSCRVDLSSVVAWREFSMAIRVVPNSDVLKRAFLWCSRHRAPLVEIKRPSVPVALEKLDHPSILGKLFELFPYFIANSEKGFRCTFCFDAAERFTELLAKNPNPEELRQLIAYAEANRTFEGAGNNPNVVV